MAREEYDREDLLAEATALVERAELAMPGRSEPIVIGFRHDGCGSIYLSAQQAWHFNSQHRLRRAYVDGLLYKAEKGRLVALRRVQAEHEVQLVRRELAADETAQWLDRLASELALLRQSLDGHTMRVLRQVPHDAELLGRIHGWLVALAMPVQLADSPRAR